MAVFGERAEKILKPAIEVTGIKVSRARCDKEITLPKRERIDLDKELIALRSRESSLWSSADSLSSLSEPVIFRILMGVFKGYSIPDR